MTLSIPRQAHDLSGERKGPWTIVSLDSSTSTGLVRWRARCECGREKVISAGNWRGGKGTQSCACQPRPANYNQLPDGEASFNLLYAGYARKARQRGLTFDLGREEFRALTKQACTYCGTPPSQQRKTVSGTPYTYSGVDRIDPRLGYVAGNVTPCCRYCNQAKSDLTIAQWREHITVLWSRLCQP